MKKISIFLLLSLFSISVPLSAQTADMKIYKELKGRLTTNLRGTSASIPPHVKVIRSKGGMEYFINQFREIRNYSVHLKVNQLERELKHVNFEKHMLLVVMTEPIDNYSLSVSRVVAQDEKLKVYANYFHSSKREELPSQKSVYYDILMLKKSDMPVMLKLNNLSSKKRADEFVYLTGRLLYWKYSDLQLVPQKVRKRKSIIYYIKGHQAKQMEKYVGRLVTLKAVISRDQDSPYEKDIVVEKVTKVHETP